MTFAAATANLSSGYELLQQGKHEEAIASFDAAEQMFNELVSEADESSDKKHYQGQAFQAREGIAAVTLAIMDRSRSGSSPEQTTPTAEDTVMMNVSNSDNEETPLPDFI